MGEKLINCKEYVIIVENLDICVKFVWLESELSVVLI